MIPSTLKIANAILTAHPTWKLFPLARGTKDQPLIDDNLDKASSDWATIEAWHKKFKGCGWGIALKRSKLIVVDVDTKPGKVGATTILDHALEDRELSPTYEVRSPSGGRHVYYNETPTAKHRFDNKGRIFGKDVDSPNYVLAAGCKLSAGGEYELVNDAPVADAPAWFDDLLGAVESQRVEQIPEVEQDTDAVRRQCVDYLTNDAPIARQGDGGDATTLEVFGKLKDLGASEPMAVELADELWNDRNEPPWDRGDARNPNTLDAKARNAYTYLIENAPGSIAPAEVEFGDDPFTAADEARVNAEAVKDFAKAQAKDSANGDGRRKERKRGIGDNSKGAIIGIDLSMVKPRNVDFIWPGRLAKGKQTAFAGEGGIGKSQITIDMAARITNGSAWPDAKYIREQGWPKKLERAPRGFVVILSAEDDVTDTILPRLIAAGGDPKMIRVIDGIKDERGKRKFSLQDDLAKLKTYCIDLETQTGIPVQLIIIDPASSYMGGAIDASKNTAVRSVLDPITNLAQDLQCAIVSVTHFRKGSSAKAVEKVMDSVAFVNAPRVALGAFRDPSQVGDFNNEPTENFIFTPMKTNLPGQKAVGLSYRIEEVNGGKGLTDERDGTPIKTSKIVWLDKTTLTADDISQMDTERGSPKLNAAITFMRETLPEDVPVLVKEVMDAADAEGIAKATLLTAKRRLRVAVTKPSEPGGPRSWVRPSGARTDIEIDAAEPVEVE